MCSITQSRAGRAFSVAALATVLLAAAACSPDAVAPTTGALALRIDGLPAGVSASVQMTGPQSTPRTLASSDTLEDLAPGEYQLAVQTVTARGSIFEPATTTVPVRITAGQATSAVVSYRITTGSLVIVPSGLPADVGGSFVLTSPDGSARTIAGRDTLTGLPPGRYAVRTLDVVTTLDSWTPLSLGLEFDVLASTTPAAIPIDFRIITGRIAVDVQDLPGGLAPPITITGPNGFRATVGASTVLRGIVPGPYRVSARSVSVPGAPLAGVPAVQDLDVRPGETPAQAAVRYTSAPPFDLQVAGVTVSQSVQRPDNSIPLIAGKAAVVRVAVVGSEANAEQPTVRVRFVQGASVLHEATVTTFRESVPLARDDNDANSTWNVPVPAELVRPGVGVQVDVDPENRVAERANDNNRFPATGALALDARTVPTARIRFVPLTINGATGDPAIASDIVDMSHRIFPLGEIDWSVRAPFVSSAPTLQSDDRNGAWQQVLGELAVLRVAESSNATYYGIARTPYSGGIAGMASLGQPVAMGWDRTTASVAWVGVHELGHTWGRLHAPCGNPAGIDPRYPDYSGVTGSAGYDIGTGEVRHSASPDIMGYCGTPWISAYTYEGIMAFRGIGSPAAALLAAEAPAQPVLLVWGRVTPRGEVILEPAFEVTARPSLPTRQGGVAVRGVDAGGAELFSLSFEPAAVADRPNADRPFAFAVPLDAARLSRLASLRASGPAGAARQSGRRAAPASRPTVTRVDGTRARVRWDAAARPAALVRDPATGRILGIVRGGDAVLPTGGAVELLLSDGVRSVVERVAP